MKNNYTLESIAKLAGVSRATVSRVVNNQKYVNEDIRKKVMDTIRQVGYVPNAVARSLASKQTNNIGVLVFGLDPYFLQNQVFFEIIQGIHEESSRNNYDLILYSSQGKNSDTCYKIIGKKMVDALIVMGEQIDIDLLKILYESEIPIILIGKRDTKDMNIPYVCSDYENGAYTATHYLIERGRRRTAILLCFKELLHEKEKLNGYKKALKEAGIRTDELLIYEGGAQKGKAYKTVHKMLQEHPDINGIFTASDFMAMGAIQAIKEIGKTVPEDISIIGFDDIVSASLLSPALTTIRQDKRELGIQAVKLYNALKKEEAVSHKILETELIIRDSTI